MNELIVAIFGMIVTGLAFVIYHHKKKGRKLVKGTAIIAIFFYIYFQMYWKGKLDSNYESQSKIINHPEIPFEKGEAKIRNLNSNKDSAGRAEYRRYIDTLTIQMASYFQEIEIRKKILSEQQSLSTSINGDLNWLAKLKWASACALIILYSLTYLLKRGTGKNKNNKINKEPQTTLHE